MAEGIAQNYRSTLGLSLKDKIPPHNLDAEEATLGALLLDWAALDRVVSFLRPDRFYSRRNQLVLEAMLSLSRKGMRGDHLTVIEELRSLGSLENAGGEAYIASLADTVPTSANIEYYARTVLETSVRRELIKTASVITAEAHDDTKTSRETLETAQQRIFELTDLQNTHEIKPLKKILLETVDQIQLHCENKNEFTGIPSGFPELDTMTNGFHDGEMIIIGARPSIGKTAMALSMIQHIAFEKQVPTGFFSLEMSTQEIGQRLVSQLSRVPSGKLRSGLITKADWVALNNAAEHYYESPLYVVDSPLMKMLDLRGLARNMITRFGVEIIFIDYITYITPENNFVQRYEQVAEISRSLKALARELKIPVIVLSQVARSAQGKEPTLAELRESGSLEQDADMVLFIHRPTVTGENDKTGLSNETELILAKQRNGPVGRVNLVFLPQITKFENAAREQY
ncbi:MAG: replicative DNA helicase [Spirochaetaceae bacterium]|jgi:replicative DNA helicase|nr:replicative DNA helicase [Spirochaetaceae bacterium]